MAKKEKEIELQTGNSEVSKNLLNSLLKGYRDSHYNFNIGKQTVISSGSLKLDYYIKVKTGNTIRIGGPAEGGKTSEAMLFSKNYMETMPKSKTIYINAEAKFSHELQKRTAMKYVFSSEEWEYGTVFVFQTNIFDTICNTLKSLLKTMSEQGEHLCIIIDSVDMLRLQDSLSKEIGESKKPAGVNWLTKEMFRQIGQEIQAFDSLLIMITQYSSTFTLDQRSAPAPHMMEGNNTHALNHQASYALYYRPRYKSSYILENQDEKPDPIKNKILGVNAVVEIKKSASDETGISIEIPIKKGKVGNCVWTEKEIFDLLLPFGMIKKSGAWIEISDVLIKMASEDKIDLKPKHQGLSQFSNYFEENPEITNWMTNKIKSTLLIGEVEVK